MSCKRVHSEECNPVTQIAKKPERMWFQVVCCCAGTNRVAKCVDGWTLLNLAWLMYAGNDQSYKDKSDSPNMRHSPRYHGLVKIKSASLGHVGTIDHGRVEKRRLFNHSMCTSSKWSCSNDPYLWMMYPLKMVIFYSYVTVYQRVNPINPIKPPSNPIKPP